MPLVGLRSYSLLQIHYPLLVAAAYAGLLPWLQGLSGASLLLGVTPDHFMCGAGVSNLWPAFLFAGILSIYGFDWREYARYAAAVTIYVTVVVLALLVIF